LIPPFTKLLWFLFESWIRPRRGVRSTTAASRAARCGRPSRRWRGSALPVWALHQPPMCYWSSTVIPETRPATRRPDCHGQTSTSTNCRAARLDAACSDGSSDTEAASAGRL